MVRSVLEYSCSVWDPHFEKDVSQIENVQRRAARLVKGDFRRQSSVTSMMKELGWKPLQARRRESRLTLLFKIINRLVAIPPDNFLSFNKRKIRNRNSKQIQVKSANVDCYKFSFFPRTIIDWNSLDEETVSCQTLENFKAALQRNN